MRAFVKIANLVMLIILCVGITLYCFSQENDISKLINESKDYIEKGDKENAVKALDTAFEKADAACDYNALIEIGDLYIAIDKSLNEKAMKAWQAAGRSKTRK